MKKIKEDNSTQKLLDLIRAGGQDHPDDAVLEDPVPCLPVTLKTKYLNLGVLITPRDLTLVMTSVKRGETQKDLIKWQHVPLPENLHLKSDAFSAFLGNCLDNFLEDRKKISIWCALESSGLNIRHITIPEVPPAKIANAAFWGLKKETEFNENREIFDFEVLGDLTIDGIKKKNILAFSAPGDDIRFLEKTFDQAGYALAGITAIPFVIQNFIRTGQVRVDDPYFAVVNISRENSEIYCFSQSGILLVRTLRTGSWNLMEELDDPQAMDNLDYSSSMTKADTDEFSRIRNTSDRLISKIVRTGDYCAQHYTGNTPIQRYVFYGETDYCEPFMHQASTLIPAAVDTLDPFRNRLPGSNDAALPQNAQQRNSVLTAFGIALSGNDTTPNFFFTFDDRQAVKKQKKITLAMVLAGILLLAVTFSTHLMLDMTHRKDLATLDRLSREQTTFGKEVQTETITAAITHAEMKNSAQTRYVEEYLPLAVIYDICHFTPDHIHLTSMAYDRGTDKKKPGRISRTLSIEGRVSGPSNILDSQLGGYILALSESPVFGNVEITDKRIGQDHQNKSLFFKATLEVL